jgi:hypothetical protein
MNLPISNGLPPHHSLSTAHETATPSHASASPLSARFCVPPSHLHPGLGWAKLAHMNVSISICWRTDATMSGIFTFLHCESTCSLRSAHARFRSVLSASWSFSPLQRSPSTLFYISPVQLVQGGLVDLSQMCYLLWPVQHDQSQCCFVQEMVAPGGQANRGAERQVCVLTL